MHTKYNVQGDNVHDMVSYLGAVVLLTLLHSQWAKLFGVLLTLLHSEWPKLYGVLAILSAIGLNKHSWEKRLLLRPEVRIKERF